MSEIKCIQVEMPDGSYWLVPAILVADQRAKWYAANVSTREKDTYEEEYEAELEFTLQDKGVLFDWASNNMDWAEVKEYALKQGDPPPVDYEDGWINGNKRLVTIEKGLFDNLPDELKDKGEQSG